MTTAAHACRNTANHERSYLVFGDLHGRILPAFALAQKWIRDHKTALSGILQVGDLGYFPDPIRLDKATKRHADRDPLELGAQWIAQPSADADLMFLNDNPPPPLWFIAGNHEDFDELNERMRQVTRQASDFEVDCYGHVWCIRDGFVVNLPGDLRVGGLWGIDNISPRARRGLAARGYIRARSATELAVSRFDVLLTHDSPRDAIFDGAGSELISDIIQMANPRFAFFGHYHGEGREVECDFKFTRAFHLAGFELRGTSGRAEIGSVGLLTWCGDDGEFEYLDDNWLRQFTRHNWRHWR